MEYSKEDLMEAKRQILGVGENMGTEESKKIWEENAQFWDNAMGDESNEFHREADKTVAAAHTQADQMVASAQQTAKELTERGQAAVQEGERQAARIVEDANRQAEQQTRQAQGEADRIVKDATAHAQQVQVECDRMVAQAREQAAHAKGVYTEYMEKLRVLADKLNSVV